MNNSKLHIVKSLSILVIAMGMIHEIATFTPMMASKFAALDEAARAANTYFSLMCGAMLIIGGVIVHGLWGKVREHSFVRTPLAIVLVALAVDGVLAVLFMPHNPFAWAVCVLTSLLAIVAKIG